MHFDTGYFLPKAKHKPFLIIKTTEKNYFSTGIEKDYALKSLQFTVYNLQLPRIIKPQTNLVRIKGMYSKVEKSF